MRVLLFVGLAFFVSAPASGQDCVRGTAVSALDAGEVRAALLNTGNLFRPPNEGGVYEVPKGEGVHAMFAATLMMGGMVSDSLHSVNAPWTGALWPGPLGEGGAAPNAAVCTAHDRIWSVTLDDVAAYNAGGPATADLADWPAHLGAPVVDGDGDPTNYDLAGGDRPAIYGSQTAWWIMNDRGNVPSLREEWVTAPLGVECG